jgi:hypothetical protein
MDKINLEKDDIAIVVKPDGTSEVCVPFRDDGENELTYQQLHQMLKEIRNLEKAFTELVNKTYVENGRE